MMKTSSNRYFPEHFKEFIRILNDLNIEYLLIGGYAMGAYGHIRATSDLDIFINAKTENADKMVAACIKFGIRKETLSKDMFLVPKMIGIGEPPLRIEILKELGIVDFNYAFERAITKKVDGISIKVVALDDLILLKKSAVKDRNHPRDHEDLTFLEKLKGSIRKNKTK
jgi:predicted nucleotidyltransferase